MPKHAIQRAFNRARQDDQHCPIQLLAGKQLISLTQQACNHATHIIDLGCGTGKLTEQLASLYSFETFHAIDIAEKRLEATANHPTISFYTADFNQLPPTTIFNLMFANLSLQWSDDFDKTLHHLYQHLALNGWLVFSMPLTGTFQELAPTFAVNHFYDAAQIQQTLTKHKYTLMLQQQQTLTLPFTNTLEALRSIKYTGASYVKRRTYRSLQGKSLLTRKVITQLTYQIGYFVACKQGTS